MLILAWNCKIEDKDVDEILETFERAKGLVSLNLGIIISDCRL